MNHQTNPHQIETVLHVLKTMNVETQEILSNLAVCLLIGALAADYGAEPTISVACIAFVQSVHLPRMYRAYRQADYEIKNGTDK